MYHWQISSSIQQVVFLFCWWFPLLCKHFSFQWSLLFIFYFISLSWRDTWEKIFLREMSEILLLIFSCRNFMVSSLTCKSLIHYEFSLLYGVEGCLVSFFLHVSVQFSQHHLSNRRSLPHCMYLLSLLSINWP